MTMSRVGDSGAAQNKAMTLSLSGKRKDKILVGAPEELPYTLLPPDAIPGRMQSSNIRYIRG